MTISVALVADADAAAQSAADRSGLRVTELVEFAEHEAAVELLREVWGVDSAEELVNSSLLRALAHSGNYVAGAYAGTRLVGAAVAFLGVGHLHSHITGVDRTAQAKGVGYVLKQHQRGWTLRHGLTRVCWTFDPLVRRNAHFNLHKLGAQVTEYLPDFYGALNDGINSGDATDRLYVTWELDSPAAVAAARGEPVEVSAAGAYPLVGRVGDEPVAGSGPVPDGAQRLSVAVPEDIESIRKGSPDLAARWRYAVREALTAALDRGYRIRGMTSDGRYLLECEEQ